ncbi:MAG: hypothetical protein HY460_01185 [Parcubacteria group bacterium]|nr:hypothetical protein [Parcubacteria group bacterium]
MKKVVSDRRVSLDEESEIRPAMRMHVQREFEKGATIPVVLFPADSSAIQDTPRLTLIVVDPELEWNGGTTMRQQIAEWTKHRGKSPRLYPGALVWCIRKPGRDLRDKVELWLAWRRVAKEIAEGTLGGDYDRAERADITSKVSDAENASKDEVWGGYRYAVITDGKESDGLKAIDLGAGHSSSGETLCGRVITALKTDGLLSESAGAGYIDRNWPPALKESGAWPLASLRQSFLNGSLTRLIDPDHTLRGKVLEFVERGDFGFASGPRPDGTYDRVWFQEMMAPDEVTFDSGVVLLAKSKAAALKSGAPVTTSPTSTQPTPVITPITTQPTTGTEPTAGSTPQTRSIRITGNIPPEVWNRLGTKILPKLRSGTDLHIGVDFSVIVNSSDTERLEADLQQALEDLELTRDVEIRVF